MFGLRIYQCMYSKSGARTARRSSTTVFPFIPDRVSPSDHHDLSRIQAVGLSLHDRNWPMVVLIALVSIKAWLVCLDLLLLAHTTAQPRASAGRGGGGYGMLLPSFDLSCSPLTARTLSVVIQIIVLNPFGLEEKSGLMVRVWPEAVLAFRLRLWCDNYLWRLSSQACSEAISN